VYEVQAGFSPPPTPPGITGHHFVHYRRPGQGIVTGEPTLGISLVLISPKEEARAQELRRSIKARECYCPLANAAYTNMLIHEPTVMKVAAEVARSRVASVLGRQPARVGETPL